eukprot:CAMPEP_0202691868 /NCGR_PEP_ID=MMETSP1385-20130828/6444_1 /ASSEMBLY_ACC=CAM_ASM_000861 /TAXON_ID=933848 /ORGANISM="Elphidium margaritaceum" /LENGTH=639 /DNA_ID=CAMNT_0049347325 /DNA_START=84 /DNA_END=2003 /DNA_ORIENTATION=-
MAGQEPIAARQIFINDIAGDTSTADLRSMFSEVGTVTNVEIDTNELNRHFAFVTFESSQGVEAAIAKFNTSNMNNTTLVCRRRTELEQMRQKRMIDARCKLFVGNIPQQMTATELQQDIERLSQRPIADFRHKKGYCFVGFSSPQDAEDARRNLKNSLCGGKSLNAEFKKEDPIRNEPGFIAVLEQAQRTLYVRDIPLSTNADSFKQIFESHGKVRKFTLPIDSRSSKLVGYAFIEYFWKEECDNALKQTEGLLVDGVAVEIRVSDPPKDKGPLHERERRGGGMMGGGGGRPDRRHHNNHSFGHAHGSGSHSHGYGHNNRDRRDGRSSRHSDDRGGRRSGRFSRQRSRSRSRSRSRERGGSARYAHAHNPHSSQMHPPPSHHVYPPPSSAYPPPPTAAYGAHPPSAYHMPPTAPYGAPPTSAAMYGQPGVPGYNPYAPPNPAASAAAANGASANGTAAAYPPNPYAYSYGGYAYPPQYQYQQPTPTATPTGTATNSTTAESAAAAAANGAQSQAQTYVYPPAAAAANGNAANSVQQPKIEPVATATTHANPQHASQTSPASASAAAAGAAAAAAGGVQAPTANANVSAYQYYAQQPNAYANYYQQVGSKTQQQQPPLQSQQQPYGYPPQNYPYATNRGY